MSIRLRIILMGLMVAALLFGFLHLFIPGATLYNFERLHIFLFNLCSGGAILICYTESRKVLSTKGRLFLILAVFYAILAFCRRYNPLLSNYSLYDTFQERDACNYFLNGKNITVS